MGKQRLRAWRIVCLLLPIGFAAFAGCQPSVRTPTATGMSCVTAHGPDWVHRSSADPKEGFHGVGDSLVSQDDADSSARRDLVKQLEVTIAGVDETVQHESTAAGMSYAVTSKVVEKVNLQIAGISVIARQVDRECGRYFALAKLDREQAVGAWRRDVQDRRTDLSLLRSQAVDYVKSGNILEALLSRYRALVKVEEAVEIGRRLDRLSASPSQRLDANEMIQTLHAYEQLLSGLQVKRVTGAEQRGQSGQPLAQPLVLEVTAKLPSGEVPVRDVPIVFSFQTGGGDLEPLTRTNQQGRGQAVVPRVEFHDFSARIIGQLAVEQMVEERFPEALRRALEQRAKQEAVVFTVLAPEETIKNGIVDWGNKVIRVKGVGMANPSFPKPLWARSAEEAAKVDAQTKLVEIIEGLKIESKTFVANYQVQADEKLKDIRGRLKGARQVGPAVFPTETMAEVVMEVRF
ncbi:MAG: LPP20 family lipoprotein [Nitrospira sp.]|nr:LPP20 family lipoprotein [Nitrospira sp.]